MITLSNLFFMVIYKWKNPYLESFKILKHEKWPWEQNYEEWRILLSKTIKQIAFNNLFMVPLFLIIDMLVTNN